SPLGARFGGTPAEVACDGGAFAMTRRSRRQPSTRSASGSTSQAPGQPVTRYADRTAAGHVLAEHLRAYAGRPDAVVLGLPRGGVVTAAAVAERLDLPLDVFC